MRVIAGQLGGRQFEAPKGHRTHPMSDKMRGSLFNVLGDIGGLTVLDTFAGSGALSIEALSRGAAHATLIDSSRQAIDVIRQNLAILGLSSKSKAIRAGASGWSANNPEAKFDLVLCDPPYDKLQINLVQTLSRHLNDSGLLVLSWPGKLVFPEITGHEMIKNPSFGDAQLVFYRKIT